MVKKYFFIILIAISSVFLYSQTNDINNENIEQTSTINDNGYDNDSGDEHIEEKVQYNSQDYFVRNLKLEKIAKNESQCFILNRKNKKTLGHFSIIKENAIRDSFNNVILANIYYVKDHALEPIAGRASQREVGILVTTYYNKYLSTLGGTVATAIIEFILVAGGISAIVVSPVLFAKNKGYTINNFWGHLFDDDFNSEYYLPMFIGGVVALVCGLLFVLPVVIVTAVYCARYYNNYILLKKSIIDSLNNIKTPISIKDSEGTPLVKIGFDFRIDITNRMYLF